MAASRKDTPTRRAYHPSAHSGDMLPQCGVLFDHLDERMDDIHETLKELQLLMMRLPADLVAAVQQHARECPAHQRAMRRAGGSGDSDPPVEDILRIAPRMPRWLIYLLGGGAGVGAIVTGILRALGYF
jgi:hypothetical protein